MVNSRGFSLVELLVTLALLAFLLMLAVPFTNTWSDSARLRDAENLLHQGIGRAKALALRNHHGMTGTRTAASLCLDGQSQRLNLYQASSAAQQADCSGAYGSPVWSAQLPKAATVKSGANDFACLALDSRGLPTANGGCSTGNAYTLSIGSDDVTITIN
ncbi:prepilin-type N-terminal cleavage/methylation domain-containing protein [Phytopseudomonas dryadis]|uniref:Prepilin-type cleavage/methylation domain-containing protein n=1 Tax=Phytopseudomonas dryadis TaxID=2487520 RepID=A0ABY1ZF27_9GAMM|nr:MULTISPECIES: prepilin-type N-terminal cleavage/methylation domain-containing protein [Pseudomonas]TBV09059.1 prepilin-type cleavage/methylation domain-containing protein [Pseudomonas dryadis]TBV18274.1 prepilin-type cleavage/methylation domain-containing protein [Pseudomonas sp. FRB 230]